MIFLLVSMYFLFVFLFVVVFFVMYEMFVFKGIENVFVVNICLLVLLMVGFEMIIYSYNCIKNMY